MSPFTKYHCTRSPPPAALLLVSPLDTQQFASSVLETRLNEVLRFTLGRTYGVSVQDSFLSAPPMLREDQPLPGTVMVRGIPRHSSLAVVVRHRFHHRSVICERMFYCACYCAIFSIVSSGV